MMKKTFAKYAFRSIVFGIVMVIFAFFGGGVRYSSEFASFPPIWFQLLLVFVISTVVFLVVQSLADVLIRKIKKDSV